MKRPESVRELAKRKIMKLEYDIRVCTNKLDVLRAHKKYLENCLSEDEVDVSD